MSAHTPGPWSFRGSLGPHSNPGLKGPHIVENATGIQICILNGWRTEVSEANARILAAAPELYEALEAMLAEFNEQMSGIVHDELAAISKARAALAKARGGS